METCCNAANSTAQQMRQHSTLSMTLCGSRNTNRLLMSSLWQLVNFWRADVPRQASVDLRDEMKQFGRRLTCGGKRAAERTARPGGPREDLGCRRMDVDWDQQNGICFTHPHTHTHTHTHTQPHTYTAEILVFRAELQLSSFSVYLFFFLNSEGAKTLNFTL